MTKQDLIARMREARLWVPGKRVRIEFGAEQGTIMLDGRDGSVSDEAGSADTVVRLSWDDWQQLVAGQLNGTNAYMTGRLEVDGDVNPALQLQAMLAKLKG